MVCLFGVNKNNWTMSLQFKDVKTNNIMKSFFDFIQNMEFKVFMQTLGLDEDDSRFGDHKLDMIKRKNMIPIY